MITYFIEFNKTNSTARIIPVLQNGQIANGLVSEYSNVTIKENSINERIYIVDSKEEQKEFLSLPLVNTIIKTTYNG